jgi:hypothetical protein
MRKHFLLGLTAVAAMCLFSCNKENVTPSESTQTITFTALTPDTKTHFGEKADTAYPTLWTGNEQVAVSYNGSAKTTASVSGTGKSASISAETVVDGNAAEHKFMLASPAAAITSLDSGGDIYFTIPSVQTPGEGTCDEAAQIIYATASCTAEEMNSNISLTFKHLTAYGNMSVVLPEGAEKVKQIELLTAATGLTGSYRYGSLGLKEDVKKDELTILTDKTTGIFFACAPADLNGENLVVTVTTEKGVYEKDIDLKDKKLSFTAGKVSKFTVTGFKMKALVTESWNLVTDASTLKVGDEIIIAAKDADYAIGVANKNNFGVANIIKSGNTLENPSENNVSVLTLEAGTKANTFALKSSGGYLYAASSDSNYLKVQNSIDDNASWSITISNTAATIKSNGKNTRNTIKYNPNTNNNNPLFSCYNNGQEDVVIYVKNTTILDPSIPFLTVTPGKYDTKIPAAGQTLTFKVMTNPAEWTVTSSDVTNFAVAKAADGFTVTVSKNTDTADRNATITVTAGELTKPIELTQSGVVSVNSVTYTVRSKTSVSTSGTAPEGSSITFKSTSVNGNDQMTSGKSQTYTIKGFEGCTIKKVVLSMHSNSSKGAGTFSLKAGTTELAAIKNSTTFDKWYNNTSYSTSYKDVTVSLTNDSYTIKANEDVVIVITASVNSLYCQSVTIEYEQ